MKTSPRFWALISVLALLGAFGFWHLGNRRAAHQPAPAPATNATNLKAAKPRSSAAPFRIVSPPPTTTTGDAASAPGAPEPSFLLSNTSQTLDELIRNDRAIILRNAHIDTAQPVALSIPAHLRSQGDPGSYIVQARGLITDAFRQALVEAGAEIISYIPNNAYLVRADEAVAQQLATTLLTEAVLPFEPYYKLEPALLARAYYDIPLPEDSFLNVTAFPGQRDAVVAALADLQAEVMAEERTPFGPMLVVRTRGHALTALARLPAVQIVEKFRDRHPANDLTRVRLNVSSNTLAPAPAGNYLGLSGVGVTVAVSDTGIDSTHPDFGARVVGDVPASLGDADGHGTHVAGTIAGDGTQSGTVPVNPISNALSAAYGSIAGANFRGMAPAATLLSMASVGTFPAVPFRTDQYLQETAALSNAPIMNNSWYYPGSFDYDVHAASYDAAVRDALIGIPGPQPLLMVFPAGNSGGGTDDGQGGTPGTIVSPGTAKNVITVGASELPRFITNEVTIVEFDPETATVFTNSYPYWLGMTDSSNEVAGLSGRGNTGLRREGIYGRNKPDVVAPGTVVVSCRSSNFTLHPTTFNSFSERYDDVFLPAGSTNLYSFGIYAPNPINFTVTVSPNAASPVPFPALPIHMKMNSPPTSADYVADTTASIGAPPLTNGILYYSIGNPGTNGVHCDITATLTITNNPGDFYTVLSNMNAALGGWYRYEWGSSMSAAAVSGTLALMQEYFQNRGLTNSPACMKALLINGARSMHPQYDFYFRTTANIQGWGLVNLTNCIPAEPARSGARAAVQFIDQEVTNALPTGFSHTRILDIAPTSVRYPLRVTLVWTDPPANPVTGTKLVNDLDLIVTNLATGQIYVGNNFGDGSLWCVPLSTNTGSTNALATNFTAALDYVNNVENVYIPGPLGGTQFSVTVRARRVPVNGVDAYPPDRVVQDYALVVSCGTTQFSGGLSFANAGAPTLGIATNPVVMPFNTNYAVLTHERVGANPPFLTTTNGLREQWNFYVFTNSTAFTNVVFATFIPQNAAFLQPNQAGPRAPAPRFPKPRYYQADLDLYVAQGPNAWGLTNLDPAVISTCDRSLSRLGTEYIVYSNSTPGAVYYVGVKSEDQQAADYSFIALASRLPFSFLDSNGQQVVNFYPVPIPDGTPDSPGGTNTLGFALLPMTIQRVTVEASIFHEQGGDLLGNLSHQSEDGEEAFVVLNNHRVWYGLEETLYDDSGREDLDDAVPPDGPGGLTNFMGMEALGVWYFDIVDNALHHTGAVQALTVYIEPVQETNDAPYARTIGPRGWLYSVVDVPPDATNLHVCVSDITGPVDLYIRHGAYPTLTDHDRGLTNIAPPGACLDWSVWDNPPLRPGRHYIGVFNPDPVNDVSVVLTIEIQRDLRPRPLVTYASTNATPLLDDAMTNAVLFVTNNETVAMIEVGVRIEHERAADLVLHLVSPQGTRTLLAENRGLTNTLGYGANFTNVVTNILATVLDDGFENAPGGFGYGPGTILSGWRVDAGDVDILYPGQGFIGLPHTGSQCIDMQGWGTNGLGAVSTNVPTLVGETYLLSLAYTKNPNTLQGTSFVAQAEVRFNGQTLSLTYSQPNYATNLNWSTTSVVFRASNALTRVELASLTPGNGGMYFDTVQMFRVRIETNLYLYARFTEDTTLTTTPIKFGEPPWVNTHFLTNVWFSSFESAAATNYPAGTAVEGWDVITNQAAVITTNLAYHGTNVLAPGDAVLRVTLPTVAGRLYELSYAYRADPGLGQPLPIDGSFENPPGFPGATYPAGFVFGGWTVGLVDINHMPASGWQAADGSSSIDLNGNAGPGSVHRDIITRPGELYTLRFAYSGNPWTNPPPQPPINPIKTMIVSWGPNTLGTISFDTTGHWFNNMGWTYTNFSVTGSGMDRLRFASAVPSGQYGPALDDVSLIPRTSVGVAQLVLNGTPVTNTIITTDPYWRLAKHRFLAPSSGTVLEVRGLQPGVWLDAFRLVESTPLHLPEEPLRPIFGENAFGPWRLEIWDNRLGGQTTNAQLLSWELSLGFVRSNALPWYLTNHVAATGVVSGTDPAFFMFDVACTNGTVAFSLTADNPVDLLLNPFGPPTTVPGDLLLLYGTTNGTATLPIGPLPIAGPGRYFLAVQNTFATTNTAFSLQVDIVCATNPPVAPVINAAASGFGSGGFTLRWTAPASAQFQVEYADHVLGPWTAIPVILSSPTGDFSFTDDGTHTPPVISNRFYRLVLLRE